MSPSPAVVLDLGDPEAVSDLRVYLTRARSVDHGSVRLQAVGGVLAVYVCVIGPRILGEPTPTVLGLRTLALAREAHVDATVPMAAVFDRLARLGDAGTGLELPPTRTREAWAAVSPPRGPWEPQGSIAGDDVLSAAAAGIAEVAGTVPQQPGAAMLHSVRSAVWGRDLPASPGVPSGAAFAAQVLGFAAPGNELRRFGCGPWVRLSSSRGHVLCRRPSVLAAV
ncbi:hypothetical protein SCMU_23300 [Sinomonas cyclohexanicum]|uniref:Uncharacterized protein n=1 Tax=Sinomonas cyclohexanicum TaxID=322009 RepID=A0ABM7PWN2_SINCY|nr:hypothetical protein [Corynebacterium cyclohexanicum]BCT76488.1 hypothetical protein SCMU_23300 [Corynebacterium cyclohexanicum]